MSRWPNDKIDDLIKFYGNPDGNGDGQPDPQWEARYIVRFRPELPMMWSWNKQPVTRLACHERCATSLSRILSKINRTIPFEIIQKHRLYECAGTWNFRPVREGTRLSTHAFGAAIDLSPTLNPLRKTWDEGKLMMPRRVVDIFENEGWTWGGLWHRPDGMHFQAAEV